MRLRLTRLVALVCLALPSSVAASGSGVKADAAVPEGGRLLPWKGEQVVYSGFSSDHGLGDRLPKEEPDSPVMKAYRARTGNVSIKWQIVPPDDYRTKLNIQVQSGDLPDVLWNVNYLADSAVYGPQGLFLNFGKYTEYMPNVQKWAATMSGYNNVLTPDGARYAVQDVITAEWLGEGWFYNSGILAKAGLSGPPDTLADMLQAMKRVKAAVPGVDGFYTYFGIQHTKQAIAYAMNAKLDVQLDFDTGKWVYGPTMDPRYRETLEYLAAMYQGGLLNPEILSLGSTAAGERQMEIFADGKFAFSYHYYGDQKARFLDMGKPQVMKGMRSPRAADGKRYYWITVPHDSYGNSAFMANARAKRPELLAAYVDNIMSYETYELKEWGLEGVTFRRTPEGGYEFLPEYRKDDPGGLTAGQKLTKQGVGALLDTTTSFADFRILWFYKYFTGKGDVGREACGADINALTSGEMVPAWRQATPVLGVEASDVAAKTMTPVKTFVAEEELKFITGRRPFSEWSNFIAQANKMGDIAKVLGYYNAARQFPIGERSYPILPPDLR